MCDVYAYIRIEEILTGPYSEYLLSCRIIPIEKEPALEFRPREWDKDGASVKWKKKPLQLYK